MEMTKFEMIEKHKEYKAVNLPIRIIYQYSGKWHVYGFDGGNRSYEFNTLNAAKRYIRERMGS